MSRQVFSKLKLFLLLTFIPTYIVSCSLPPKKEVTEDRIFALSKQELYTSLNSQALMYQGTQEDLYEEDSSVYVEYADTTDESNDDDIVYKDDEDYKKNEPSDEDLWCRIRGGYGIYLQDDSKIEGALHKYSKSPQYFEKISLQAHPYLYHIVKEVEKRGMPSELALLPAIESLYEPMAESASRAAGIWQFVPGTGKNFGLKQNAWYDGRRDIVASTDAALTYLQRLYQFFDGDWLNALAAYNYGEGNILNAIKRNRARGLPTDYWSLDLPRETREFVPKLLAIARIIADPEFYGIQLHTIENEPYFAQIEVGTQIDLSVAAQMAGISLKDMKLLNPGYRRYATAPKGPHCLALPVDKVKTFKHQLVANNGYDLLPKKIVYQKSSQETPTTNTSVHKQQENSTYRIHHVRKGDTFKIIAQKYGTTISELNQLNKQANSWRLSIGQAIKVPDTGKQTTFVSNTKKPQSHIVHYVRKGDTFRKIAKQYDTTIVTLQKLNKTANSRSLKIGQEIKVPMPEVASSSKPSEQKITHTVRSGDSLWTISQAYQVSVDKLTHWNQIPKRQPLQLGQKLTILAR